MLFQHTLVTANHSQDATKEEAKEEKDQTLTWGDWCGPKRIYMVISKISYFHPYLGKWSNFTHIFQMGWNHQLGINGQYINSSFGLPSWDLLVYAQHFLTTSCDKKTTDVVVFGRIFVGSAHSRNEKPIKNTADMNSFTCRFLLSYRIWYPNLPFQDFATLSPKGFCNPISQVFKGQGNRAFHWNLSPKKCVSMFQPPLLLNPLTKAATGHSKKDDHCFTGHGTWEGQVWFFCAVAFY